jgi:hypothetical protein
MFDVQLVGIVHVGVGLAGGMSPVDSVRMPCQLWELGIDVLCNSSCTLHILSVAVMLSVV